MSRKISQPFPSSISGWIRCLVFALASATLLTIGHAQEKKESENTPAQPATPQQLPKTIGGLGKAPSKSLPIDFENLARLPYKQLMKIAQSDVSQPKNAEYYKLKIESSIPGVKFSDIELFLDQAEKPLILAVDDKGFFQVPNSIELFESNPDLVANQPKGTLNILVTMGINKEPMPKVVDGKIAYQELFKPLVKMEEQMRNVNPLFGMSGHDQFVLELETGEKPVKITRSLGSRTYRPNSKGKIYMIKETYLYEENPNVEIPDEVKMNIIPASPQEVEDIRAR